MRFVVAWANVLSENQTLKLVIGGLTLVVAALAVVVVKLENRRPLIIERGCLSRAVPSTDGKRSADEVETFIREALPMRFDSAGGVKPSFLSEDEMNFRIQEQQEFKKRDLSQRIVVNHAFPKGDQVTVDADRLLSFGTVRSALAFPLAITLGTIPRTEANPYGLMILQVSAQPAQPQGPSQVPVGGGR